MSSEALLERVRQIIATIFNVPLDQVTPQTSTTSIENWDSMGHLMLILEIEQHFDVQLDPEQVERMNSVAAIVQLLESIQVPVLR